MGLMSPPRQTAFLYFKVAFLYVAIIKCELLNDDFCLNINYI